MRLLLSKQGCFELWLLWTVTNFPLPHPQGRSLILKCGVPLAISRDEPDPHCDRVAEQKDRNLAHTQPCWIRGRARCDIIYKYLDVPLPATSATQLGFRSGRTGVSYSCTGFVWARIWRGSVIKWKRGTCDHCIVEDLCPREYFHAAEK